MVLALVARHGTRPFSPLLAQACRETTSHGKGNFGPLGLPSGHALILLILEKLVKEGLLLPFVSFGTCQFVLLP